MELALSFVEHSASVWDVKRAVGAVLHGDAFLNADDPKARRM